jgi:hypothetical protein
MILTFPLPPSSNNAYATFNGRRIPSRELKAWRIEARCAITEEMAFGSVATFGKPYALHYRFNVNHQSDIANREKAATDLLVALGIVPDDCWCDFLTIRRDRNIDGAIVEIEQL